MRRIAAEAGYSTMGVYSRFGGKDGIVEELFVDGFRRLRATMDGAVREDAQHSLAECGLAYRRFGVANPTQYQVMFERVVPGFVPSAAAQLEGMATFGALVARVEASIAAGVLAPGDATEVAHRLWAASHGWVSLQIHDLGWLGDDQERAYAAAMDALVAGMAGPNHRPGGARRRDGSMGAAPVSRRGARTAAPSARRASPRPR